MWRHQLCTILIFLVAVKVAFSRVFLVSEKGLGDLVPNYLFVFVAYYHPSCSKQPGLGEFEIAEQIAEETNLTVAYDIRFARVNLRKVDNYETGLLRQKPDGCTGPPYFELFKFGVPIRLGRQGKLVKDELTTKAMFEFLEKHTTKSRVDVATSDAEVKMYEAQNEFSILGYFKEYTGTGLRNNFYRAANRLKYYNFAEVRNQDLVRKFERDTVVINQQFGTIKLELDENLSENRVTMFVRANVNSTRNPVISVKLDKLQETIDTTMQVFVMFYHYDCKVPEIFEFVADLAKENGMMDVLDLKFVTVDIEEYESDESLEKYSLHYSDCNLSGKNWTDFSNVLRLFKYGKMTKYGESSLLPNVTMDAKKLKTLSGMMTWLEENTKPAARPVWTMEGAKLIVEFNEISVIGYFQKGSQARMEFHKAADSANEYVWGDVLAPEINPFNTDMIVVFKNYGKEQVNFTWDNKMTNGEIQRFVKNESSNSQIPIPTRPTPPMPSTTTEKPEVFYRMTKQIAIFDRKGFQGNRVIIDLTGGCVIVPKSWGLGTFSIKTYSQCVYFYEEPGCDADKKRFRLDIQESREHWDISDFKSIEGFQSMQFCPEEGEVSAGKSRLGVHLGFIMTLTIFIMA
ncbi:uncharacterized protein LOC110842225 [Folsomia candida]|uniref:Protein disulfide-isomerase n=1 Tax=Folsomia candida TaxID=158441 RepID=A0A226EXI4_FOLCA|nr:uncharacterized protein LOC110842225 [Folsomia candida]OXA61326.1 Protein disulfide-isomerase [Folsomia candida]